MIANINHVKQVMGELRAKKKYGQNFLIDSNIVDRLRERPEDDRDRTGSGCFDGNVSEIQPGCRRL